MMSIIVEGVLAIQAGQSPKSIEKKLYSLIDPKNGKNNYKG